MVEGYWDSFRQRVEAITSSVYVHMSLIRPFTLVIQKKTSTITQ